MPRRSSNATGVVNVRAGTLGAARGGRGRSRQDAARDELAGLIEPQRLQRQPPLKGAPIGQAAGHRRLREGLRDDGGLARQQREQPAGAVLIPSTTESRKRVMVKPPCEGSGHSRDSVTCISKMCATGGHRPGEGHHEGEAAPAWRGA